MRLHLLSLLFGLVLSTGVRAQNVAFTDALKQVTNIAFIKSTGPDFPADSITIRTSLDTLPYGFAFDRDTMFLDVSIFPPVDEVTVELLAADSSFGRFSFWVDAPSANVHLSVKARKTIVDSVTLSGVMTWFNAKLEAFGKAKTLSVLSRELNIAMNQTSDNLMSLTFAEALVNLPYLPSAALYELKEFILPGMPFLLKRHPRYQALLARVDLLLSKPVNFKKIGFVSASGQAVKIRPAEDIDYYVLDLYSSASSAARRAHKTIMEDPQLDSLFLQVAPMISISNDSSPALWRLYVNDNNFSWRHYVEDFRLPRTLSSSINLDKRPLYLLMTRKGRVAGVYYNLQSLVNSVVFKTQK